MHAVMLPPEIVLEKTTHKELSKHFPAEKIVRAQPLKTLADAVECTQISRVQHPLKNDKPEDDAPLPWERFSGSAALQGWRDDLCRSLNKTKPPLDWKLTGSGVMVVCSDVEWSYSALRRIAKDAGLNTIRIGKDQLMAMENLLPYRKHAPALIYLEPGSWMEEHKDTQPSDEKDETAKCQQRIGQWLREFSCDKPLIIATSAKSIGVMTERLRHPGLFDRYLMLPERSFEEHARQFIEDFGQEHFSDSITCYPNKVGKLLRMDFDNSDRRLGLLKIRLERLIAHENRPIEFIDLVTIASRGLGEADYSFLEGGEARRTTAYHEAGHAAICVIDSCGNNIPDFATALPSPYFSGTVVASYDYQSSINVEKTYETLRHGVRVFLAGRAAEEIVFGAAKITNGVHDDLVKATEQAEIAFAFLGYSPSMTLPGKSSLNLAVSRDEVSPDEEARIRNLVRQFLEEEYRVVLEILNRHRPYLDAIAESLIRNDVIDQNELSLIGQLFLETT